MSVAQVASPPPAAAASPTPSVSALVSAIEKKDQQIIKPAVPKKDLLKYINAYFANTDGRDKFNKFVQNFARLLMYYYVQKDAKSVDATKWKATFILFRDFRKLERLFKGLADIDKARDFLAANKPLALVNAAGRLGWCAYWTFDNLSLAAQAKLIAPRDEFNKYSAMGWWFALTVALYTDSLALADTFKQEKEIAKDRDSKTGADKIQAIIDANKRAIALKQRRKEIYINFVKNGADWLVSGQGFQLWQKLGFQPLNDGVLGSLGIISSGIVMAQVAAGL